MSRTPGRGRAVTWGAGVLAATVAAGLATGVAPAQAARTVSESYVVPADGTLRLSGHGFGHGRGMSQYGARGAARAGLTHRQILAFYYPGTSLATSSGAIRVLITADTDGDVRVGAASGLRVRDVSSAASYVLPERAGIRGWRLRTVSGRTTLEYDDGAWHAYRPGGASLSDEAEFHRGGALSLHVGGGTRVYRGTLRLSSSDTVNVVSLDDYVKGVVPREMPTSWEAAAVRAQAVAARTYAAFDRAAHPTRHHHTCDTTSCQVYGGVGSEEARGTAAVTATAGQVLVHGGKPAFTQFSASSGGWTVAGSQPYLVARADPYDGHSGNPVHSWTTTLTRAAVQRAWPSLGTLRRVVVNQRDGRGDWSGRVERMVLDGSRADVTVSGTTFRSALGLRSAWFRFGSGAAPAPVQTPTPSPAPSPTTGDTPITARWKAIGGHGSVVGSPTGGEYAVAGGRARRFERGRMFSTYGAGAHELYSRVLTAYVQRGGATSRLGFPRTRPLHHADGTYARFQHGVLFVYRSGRVKVTYSS